jgi:hypothetical protein
MGLVQLPVAAQNQEHEHLDAEDDGSRRERGGEVLDALVLFLNVNVCWYGGHGVVGCDSVAGLCGVWCCQSRPA